MNAQNFTEFWLKYCTVQGGRKVQCESVVIKKSSISVFLLNTAMNYKDSSWEQDWAPDRNCWWSHAAHRRTTKLV